MRIVIVGQTWQLIDERDCIRALIEVDSSYQSHRVVLCPTNRYDQDYVVVLMCVASHVVQYIVNRPGFPATSQASLPKSVKFFEETSLPQFMGKSKKELIDGLSRLGVEVTSDVMDAVALQLGQVIIDPVLKSSKVMIGEFGKNDRRDQKVTFIAKGDTKFRAWKMSFRGTDLVPRGDVMPRGDSTYTINSSMGLDAVSEGDATHTLSAPFTGPVPRVPMLSSSWNLVEGHCAKGDKIELGLWLDKLFLRGSIDEIRELLQALLVHKGKFVVWH